MKPEIKKEWLAALRSGQYKQGQGRLRVKDTYCCLGVLCDLHSKKVNKNWQVVNLLHAPGAFQYAGEVNYIPTEVVHWSGLDSVCPMIGENQLASINDSGKSFREIANLIEKYL